MTTITKSEVKEIIWPGKTYLTIRIRRQFDTLSDFFKDSYAAIYGTIYKNGLQASEPPCAIYYSVNETEKEVDLAAAIPVQGPFAEIKGFEKVEIPSSKALTITHHGSYESMGADYTLMEKYMAEHGLKKKWMIEEYLSDPAVEKDPANLKTNIYFILE